jgi:hypothetical protein
MTEIFERDDFLKAYPIDICAGLILGGIASMIFADYTTNMTAMLVGESAVIIGVVWVITIALSLNTGTHSRRL